MKGWNRTEIKSNEELPVDAWTLGYFRISDKTWARNFHELMIRDLALFALGDVRGKRVLDVGCGSGEYMDIIAKMGGEVSGQDIFEEAVKRAKEMLKTNGFSADIKVGDAEKLQFKDNYFDGVFSADLFEHIEYDKKEKIVSEIYRVLKPGGALVIKTPNLDYLKITLLLKRIAALLRFKNPFRIYIAHTRNNPDNQHCGLTTYAELERILLNNMFHYPEIFYVPLVRRGLPAAITKFLYGKKKFTEQIIIWARKPLFYGFFPN